MLLKRVPTQHSVHLTVILSQPTWYSDYYPLQTITTLQIIAYVVKWKNQLDYNYYVVITFGYSITTTLAGTGG